MLKTYRGWINQPSNLQPLHYLHGRACIVQDVAEDATVDIYFTEGKMVSMSVPRACISKGETQKTSLTLLEVVSRALGVTIQTLQTPEAMLSTEIREGLIETLENLEDTVRNFRKMGG